ncbi:MAG: carbamoyltransferase [Mucilaginibacter sp.]
MYILGISAYFHDSAACLLKDGIIIAAVQEERFTRKKNDDQFPLNSIRYCLDTAHISLKDLDYVVFYEKPFLKFERLLETYLTFAPAGFLSFIKAMPIWLKEKIFIKKNILKALSEIDNSCDEKKINLRFVPHHLSHAASAFYPSPFSKAVILTVDGVGEWATSSISIGENDLINLKREIRFPHSIGLLYSAFTYYLGFKVNVDEYKVMGLAPYGKPIYESVILQNLIDLKQDGSFRLNMKYFNYCAGLTMISEAFDNLFGKPARKAIEEIKQFHMDIACSIQTVTEKIMLLITSSIYDEFKIDSLCMAGGVALNCVANGKILKNSGFKNIWIQPASGDAGGALGAAYTIYYHYAKNNRAQADSHDKMQGALLGPSYDEQTVRAALISADMHFEEIVGDEYYNRIALYLADGKVIGYFKGRMEFGPRALGARSIIADPRHPDMQTILNKKIKFRESFRPFAPAILKEYMTDFFDLKTESPYMLLVADVNDNKRLCLTEDDKHKTGFEQLALKRSVIPAVTHINYSARIQTVDKAMHPDFYKLISAFNKLTGCPLVVNTSFNRMDEPIVNTPIEAIDCFKHSEMDVLVIENFIIEKNKIGLL